MLLLTGLRNDTVNDWEQFSARGAGPLPKLSLGIYSLVYPAADLPAEPSGAEQWPEGRRTMRIEHVPSAAPGYIRQQVYRRDSDRNVLKPSVNIVGCSHQELLYWKATREDMRRTDLAGGSHGTTVMQ